jgi:hypothetical protein
MNLKCLFGYHDWGRQKNVREIQPKDSWLLFTPLIFFFLLAPPKHCDVECIRCGKIKTIIYDSRRGRA